MAFSLLWLLFWTAYTAFPCSGESGSPFVAPASPAGRYCSVIDPLDEGGRAGAKMLVVPFALALVGAIGIWRRSARFLVVAALSAIAIFVLNVALFLTLPTTCPGDDESRPGCSHY